MTLEFTNKVILITGSSSGIGEATAFEFAKHGARVVITGRNAERLKLVEEKCKAVSASESTSNSVLAIVADLTKEQDLKMLVDTVIKEFGQLDVLVNNAGMSRFTSILDPNALLAFDQIMNTNLRSIFTLTLLAIPYLIKTKGNIVNVSSIGGTKPFSETSAYCMSKAALDMFTKCLALEIGPQEVRVNCVQAGVVKTGIFSSAGLSDEIMEAFFKGLVSTTPLRRIGEPVDIANVIMFLASSHKAINITGSVVVSDSGSLWGPWPDMNKIAGS